MRLIDADKLLQEQWKVETKDMFHITKTVDVVSVIDIKEAPTVEAIPVEWLEAWWKKHSEEYSSGIDGWYEVEGFYPNIFNKLLSDWEEENEID